MEWREQICMLHVVIKERVFKEKGTSISFWTALPTPKHSHTGKSSINVLKLLSVSKVQDISELHIGCPNLTALVDINPFCFPSIQPVKAPGTGGALAGLLLASGGDNGEAGGGAEGYPGRGRGWKRAGGGDG